MVMAVILLVAIAILLAFYCNFHVGKGATAYLKPLLTRYLSRNGRLAAVDTSLFRPEDDFYHAMEIPRTRGVWDIPGPLPIPFLGTKWVFFVFFRKYKMSLMHEMYADWHRKYGEIALEVLTSGLPIVHLFNRNDLEKVLKYPSRYPFRPPTDIVVMYRLSRPDRYSSLGIVNEQGTTWQKLRASLTSYITSPRILYNFLPALNVVCDDFIELLRQQRVPDTLEVHNFEDIANLMGLEAVCTLMLGRRMGFLDKSGQQPERIRQLASAVKQLFISQRDSYYGLGLWKYLPTKTYTEFVRAEEIIYDVISEMVEMALKEDYLTSAGDESEAALRSIFLNILELKDLDIRDKKSAIVDFIAAGIETLANTVLFVLSSVTNDEGVISGILADFCEYRKTTITKEAIAKADYTKACIQESYRIRPTAFCLARILEENMELSGYQLKAGTVVLCQNMIACNNDANFPNAKEYRPERWLDEKRQFTVNVPNACIVVPFGIGRRTCPGKRFVEMEVMLLLAKLLLAFEIKFKEPLQTEFEFLLAPKTPLTLIMKDRVY
ncbi:ecdysone 20-monooxygenase isoform X1 [Bactrocera oleae]|uniref:ecdysone 20-monooxygenase isoform X1 n=1 Tax=Bactrocera oleae TaxID=104688 RepID=UPI00387E582D